MFDENAFQLFVFATNMNAEPHDFRVGHSPDPDDAFMFYAMTSGKIPTHGRSFEHVLLGIDELNEKARKGIYEVSAISIHSFPEVSDKYTLMNCGGSMGEGYGPILISRSPMSIEEARGSQIAIPGKSTSSYLSLCLAVGDVNVVGVPFDQILDRVACGEFRSGVIIHEGQLTWKKLGFYNILDLGKWWNESTGLPLPLGGNIVRNDLGPELCRGITEDVRNSIEYSLENPELALEFARKWGRGIDEETNEEFVRMYVNRRTLDYGNDGREAIKTFLNMGQEIGLVRSDFDVDGIRFIGEEIY